MTRVRIATGMFSTSTPTRCKRSPLVASSFPEDLRLQDGRSSNRMEWKLSIRRFDWYPFFFARIHSTIEDPDEFFSQLRDFLNSLDLIIKQPPNDHLLLDVWIQMPSTTPSKLSLSSFEMDDLDTPEKVLIMEQRSNRIMKNFDDVCNKQRGNLANGAFNVCIWRPRIEAKAINEIVEDVSVRSG